MMGRLPALLRRLSSVVCSPCLKSINSGLLASRHVVEFRCHATTPSPSHPFSKNALKEVGRAATTVYSFAHFPFLTASVVASTYAPWRARCSLP